MIQVIKDFPLINHNSFGVEAKAAYGLLLTSRGDLPDFMEAVKQWPVLVLGGGSNVLFVEDFGGTVVLNQLPGRKVEVAGDDTALVTAGAGEGWASFVQWCLDRDLGGLENLSLIPGTVGAAPIQNIGAYGVELQEVFESLEAIHLKTGEVRTFNRADCDFDYRYSIFKGPESGKWLITQVTFRLTRRNHPLHLDYGAIRSFLKASTIGTPTIQDISRAVIAIRQSKLPDPKILGNAGSFFKNPLVGADQWSSLLEAFPEMPYYSAGTGYYKIPAGWLIEKCGWKGARRGAVGVYHLQALVLVSYGGALGADIWHLSRDIQQSVYDQFGIELEREVQVIGTPPAPGAH